MTSGAGLAALLALLPAMIGPLPVEQAGRSLVLALCGGGHVAVALDGGAGIPAAPASTPCCAKGCENAQRRRLLDRRQ